MRPFPYVRLFLSTLGAIAAFVGASAAAETVAGLDRCVAAHEDCVAACAPRHPKAGRAGCIVGCALEEAKCASGEAAETVSPWIRRELDDLQRLFDKLFDRPPEGPTRPPLDPDQDRT